jgi:hypothetical protein
MLAALLALELLGAAPAGSLVDCPPALTLKQEAVAPPAGWSASDDGQRHRLAGVTFFDGPPKELASLVYDDSASAGGEWTGIWHFGPNPRGFWIACSYSGTSVVLSRPVPKEVKVCRVRYEREKRGGPVGDLRGIDCR